MPELEQLQSLQAATNLIGPLADKALQRRNHAHFTRLAAFALRDQGWGNIRKTSGNNVDGYSVDGLVNPRTSTFSDIIVDSDGDHPALAWQPRPASAGELAAYEPVLGPIDPPVDPPPPPPPPDHLPPDVDNLDAKIEALFSDAVDALNAIVPVLSELTQRLADVQEHGIRVHL